MENISQIAFSAENVEKIVTEFYATSQVTNEFKPQLDQWLKHAQNSPEAWTFSWTLIDMTKSAEAQFFGASCLYNKVSKFFTEVPQDQYDLLKNKLLEKLLLYATKNEQQQVRLIQRKLNSTLAKLALYLIEDQWENCIVDMIQTIPNCYNEQQSQADKNDLNRIKMQLIAILLDLFTLLPEEYATLSNLSKPKRTQIHSKLKKNFHLIKDYLFNLFNELTNGGEKLVNRTLGVSSTSTAANHDVGLIENGVKCLNSWIEFSVPFNDIQPFIEFLFISIYHEPLFETSAECLTSVFVSEENLKYTNTLFKYTPRVLQLRELLNTYIQNKDTDGCVVLTKLILAFAENQLSVLFDGLLYGDQPTKQLLLQFINLIMSLSAMPGNFPVDEESSDLTFVFWYTLQDTMLGDDQKSLELQMIFRPFFINLLEIFMNKLKLPDNYDDAWTDDEKERLRCYRIDIGDAMVYMIQIIGEIMLEFIITRLINSIETTNSDWKTQESLIYMLQSVVSELNESFSPEFSYTNDNYLTSFINVLPRINYTNRHILSTTLLAVGSLGSWLERNPHLLQNAVSLSLLGLKTESVTQSASFALKDIINDCELSAFADQIIITCQECLKMNAVAHNYEVRLMSVIGLCLSDLLAVDLDRALVWLQTVIDPYLVKLNELAFLKQVDKQAQAMTCHVLNMLSQLMSAVLQRQKIHNEENASAASTSANITNTSFQNQSMMAEEKVIINYILVKLIPIYKVIIKRNLPTDLVIIDKLFESISVTLTSSMSKTSPQTGNESMEQYLNDLIEMFYSLNENAWRRFAFEVCRQILIIWWKVDKYKPALQHLFLFSNQNAMKLMEKDMNWFHEHTDVVEQYCTCLAKLLKSKYYDLFEKLPADSFVYLIRFAQLGLQLPEQYTLRAVATFIEEFVKFSKTKNYLVEFIEQNSLLLIQTVLFGISGLLPRHLVDILAGILYIYNKEYPQLINCILNTILIKNEFQPFSNISTTSNQTTTIPNQSLTRETKLAFIDSMKRESHNKRKFKEIVNEFSLTCRGLINSEYAKETSHKY